MATDRGTALLYARLVVAVVAAGPLGLVGSARSDGPPAVVAELPKLVVGSEAPALRVEAWLKGAPATPIDPQVVTLVVCFASWCGPCYESMPKLSELQEKHAERVRVVAVSVREGGRDDSEYTAETAAKVRQYVANNDARMRFAVAYDGGSKATRAAWMDASENDGVPTAFVVYRGRVLYIGHPLTDRCAATIDEALAGTFDLETAAARYTSRLREQRRFDAAAGLFDVGKVDDAVAALDALVTDAPSWDRTATFEKFQRLWHAGRHAAAMDLADRIVGEMDYSAGALGIVASRTLEAPGDHQSRGVAIAFRAATKAIEKNQGNQPGPFATLAAVHWKRGQRDEAVLWQGRAVEASPPEYRESFEAQLQQYKAAQQP